MAEVRTSTQAYCKMVLHAFKYPHAAVTGLLIAEKKRGEGGTIHIIDVVPLAHQCTSLSVAVEAALCQVDAHCHSRPPQRLIAGIYFANESLKDNSLDTFTCRIAEKIQSHFPDAVLVSLDNAAFGIDSYAPCFHQVYGYSAEAKNWKPKPKDKFILENEENALASASIAIQTKLYRELVDFDNHLDNPALDYWNTHLNSKVDSLL